MHKICIKVVYKVCVKWGYMGRKHQDKYASKKPVSKKPIDGISCVYICCICGNSSKEEFVVLSKFNRDISYFVCSKVCYSYYRNED